MSLDIAELWATLMGNSAPLDVSMCPPSPPYESLCVDSPTMSDDDSSQLSGDSATLFSLGVGSGWPPLPPVPQHQNTAVGLVGGLPVAWPFGGPCPLTDFQGYCWRPTFALVPLAAGQQLVGSMTATAAAPIDSPNHNGRAHTLPPKKYRCPECEKTFGRPSTLATHRRSHTNERPFKCGWAGCGKDFTVRSNMTRHEETHVRNLSDFGRPFGPVRRTKMLRASQHVPYLANTAHQLGSGYFSGQPLGHAMPTLEIGLPAFSGAQVPGLSPDFMGTLGQIGLGPFPANNSQTAANNLQHM